MPSGFFLSEKILGRDKKTKGEGLFSKSFQKFLRIVPRKFLIPIKYRNCNFFSVSYFDVVLTQGG